MQEGKEVYAFCGVQLVIQDYAGCFAVLVVWGVARPAYSRGREVCLAVLVVWQVSSCLVLNGDKP